nr:helix-hairpin-helix domain-containing protein [Deltaproteobacteria bacterium]
MYSRILSGHKICMEPIFVSVLVISCFLLTKYLVISNQKGPMQSPLKTEITADNVQYGRNVKDLLFFRPMDINTASLEELTLLPGIGEVNACRIVQFRRAIGFFLSVDELDTINSPLSPKLLETITPYLTVEFDY